MSTRLKFNLVFLILSIGLSVVDIVLYIKGNDISWISMISKFFLVFLFSLNVYNEKQKQNK